MFNWCRAVARAAYQHQRKEGMGPALCWNQRSRPGQQSSTAHSKSYGKLGEKRGGGEPIGSKVEGKKSRPVWEGKIKGVRGRESQCKEKVIAPPCKLSQASCRPTE